MKAKLSIPILREKVQTIREIQERRIKEGSTIHAPEDAIALTVEEAEYLFDILDKAHRAYLTSLLEIKIDE